MTEARLPLDGDPQVHLWLARPKKITDESLLERYEGLLGAEELASYRQLASADHRREYLISQAFLRDVLSYYTQLEPARFEFERNASGKPGLRNASGELARLHFNLSHSAELMACAVSKTGKVGVDVEPIEPDGGMVGMADNYFSEPEVDSLRALAETDQPRRFNQVWTLKEAYIKARGEGLTLALDSFSFEFAEAGEIRLRERDNSLRTDWHFWSLPVDGHITAIALEAPDASLRAFSGIPLQEMAELSLDELERIS